MTSGVDVATSKDAECVGKFLCVVPPKTLRVNDAGQAVRVTTNGALDDALAALEFRKSSTTVDGGGVAISVGPAIQAFTDNEVIVSFCGHLSNVDYLAWRLFSPEGRRGDKAPAQGSLEAAKKLVGGRCYEAELICHMYKTFGTKALPKLRGQYSFSCFDARSVRVFAARDSSGTYPLIYGRDGAGAVVVANFGSAVCMLDGIAALDEVPPGCFIYGHRGIKPQRFAKTDAERTAAAAEAQDAAANALRGLVLGRPRALSSNASTDKDDRRRESFDSKEQRRLSNDWSRTGGGQSRLPWRRNSQGSGQSSREVSPPQQPGTPPAGTPRTSSGATTPLNPSAEPFAAPGSAARRGAPSVPEDSPSPPNDADAEPTLSAEGAATLEALSSGPEVDLAPARRHMDPGTKEEHAQAEAVAMRAAAAALKRIASGASMKGMVRMGSSNALQALGMEEAAAPPGSPSGASRSGSVGFKRMSENSTHSADGGAPASEASAMTGSSESGGQEMAIHRVPSRSGRIADMVKVASLGNLAALQTVGSLNDLMHAGALEEEEDMMEEDVEARAAERSAANSSWADLSLLVISGGGS